jgi:hypothetical protein
LRGITAELTSKASTPFNKLQVFAIYPQALLFKIDLQTKILDLSQSRIITRNPERTYRMSFLSMNASKKKAAVTYLLLDHFF